MEGRTESDSELLSAIADGDTSALRTLYERHAPWLSVRLTRRCNDPGLVAEVVQDTFVAAWKGSDQLHQRGQQRTRRERNHPGLSRGQQVDPLHSSAIRPLGGPFKPLTNRCAGMPGADEP
jgi:hypothetical protein